MAIPSPTSGPRLPSKSSVKSRVRNKCWNHNTSRLLLVERVMPTQMRAEHVHQRMAMMDMHMLGLLGGQERTESEYRKLFGASGFTLSRVVPLSTVSENVDTSIIEAIPLE